MFWWLIVVGVMIEDVVVYVGVLMLVGLWWFCYVGGMIFISLVELMGCYLCFVEWEEIVLLWV